MPSKPKSKPPTSRSTSNAGSRPAAPATAQATSQQGPLPGLSQKQATIAEDATLPPKAADLTFTEEPDNASSAAAGSVNRKKQKRRMKEAAKRAASQNMHASAHTNGFAYETSDPEFSSHDLAEPALHHAHDMVAKELGYLNDEEIQANGYVNHNYISQEPLGAKKQKKKRNTSGGPLPDDQKLDDSNQRPLNQYQKVPATADTARAPSIAQSRPGNKDRIWNTSTAEERERIKEFWLSLGEADRRGLVRIEKEAVLKKMKEQQKHSCSCTVCGRKRTAIEEELEVLYDAYYDELETYANHHQFGLDSGPMQNAKGYSEQKSIPAHPDQLAQSTQYAMGHVEELGDDDDLEDEEGYSDEEDDGEFGANPDSFGTSNGIFSFGNSLTAQGGILTVADDLLKNDGKKFIEMMEQLAERRMQREEETRMISNGMGHPSMRNGPPDEEDDFYEEDEEDDDYNSEEEDDFEDDDMEAMTEEQRMEEGRRMFQIFAARMFEQRVLNAYRQKVAEERQKKLIEELAEDEQLDAQREAKRAREAQKKKDKRQKQKAAKEEEKAKKEAEKAAEESAARAIEEKKQEEIRLKKEEQRRKKDAERKALEEERKRKEDERQRQIRERKEQQAELERKQREQKERERKKKEDTKRAKELKEKGERAIADKKEQKPKSKAEAPQSEQGKFEEAPARQASAPMNRQTSATGTHSSASTTPGLQPPGNTSGHGSPRLPVATPVIPKAPTPGRVRQPSFQDNPVHSPRISQPASSTTVSPATSSELSTSATKIHSRKSSQIGPSQGPIHPQSRLSPVGAPLGPPQHGNVPGMTSMVGNSLNSYQHQVPPAVQTTPKIHAPGFPRQHPPGTGEQRSIGHHSHVNYPPGFNARTGQAAPLPSVGQHALPSGDANTMKANHVGQFGMAYDAAPAKSHSRTPSNSESTSPRDQGVRPAPIQRPLGNSSAQSGHPSVSGKDIDDLSNHLGSSALLDDTDAALDLPFDDMRSVGRPPTHRTSFGASQGLGPIGSTSRVDSGAPSMNNMWSNVHAPIGASARPTQAFSPPSTFGRPHNGGQPFGSFTSGPTRPAASRSLNIRLAVCGACDKLNSLNPASQGWHAADHILHEVLSVMPRNEPAVSMREMIQICDTEGNAHNGGGWFQSHQHEKAGFLLKHVTATDASMNSRNGPAPNELSSPSSVGVIGGHHSSVAGSNALGFAPVGGVAHTSGFGP